MFPSKTGEPSGLVMGGAIAIQLLTIDRNERDCEIFIDVDGIVLQATGEHTCPIFKVTDKGKVEDQIHVSGELRRLREKGAVHTLMAVVIVVVAPLLAGGSTL